MNIESIKNLFKTNPTLLFVEGLIGAWMALWAVNILEWGASLTLARGEDNAYVEWFEQIVEHAKNEDFPIAFSEFFDAEEWKFTSREPLTYPPFTSVLKDR